MDCKWAEMGTSATEEVTTEKESLLVERVGVCLRGQFRQKDQYLQKDRGMVDP